ncbi:MAG TPA: tripartite tricarboxylate transporter substrate binding protein [Ramlibacter sp.]|nr:tripartite tricarboxylate transporter substrate binding protein [Ramlibacter sp.]
MRRNFIHALFALTLSSVLAPAQAADAASFPTRPIKLIVPYAPGGSADLTARLVADALAPKLGQPVVVENRPGANGAIGTAAVAKADPDGYTLGLVVSSHVFGRALVPSLPFDPIKDFAPVTLTARTPIVLVVPATLPVRDVRELIAYARARPEKLAFASAGNGSNVHVFGQWFSDLAGLRMAHVPYKGSTAAHPDLIAGRVHMVFDSLAAVQPHIVSGKLRLLAVGGAQRVPQYPDVPTVAEAGLPGFAAESWGAVLAPARTPPAVIELLNREITAVLRSDKVRERLTGAGVQVVGSSPEELARVLAGDEKRYGDLIRKMGITLD